jgi:HEAT repeat protein
LPLLQADAILTDWAYLADWAYRASRILGKTKNLLAIAPLASAILYWLLADGVAGFSPISTLDADFRSFGANAVPALEELVSDESVVVRLHVIKLLEFAPSEAAIALLEQASCDSCKEVSDLAKRFLKKTSS